MGDKELKNLLKQTEMYKKVATIRVYATDKEISDTIGKVRTAKSYKVQSKTYPFEPVLHKA